MTNVIIMRILAIVGNHFSFVYSLVFVLLRPSSISPPLPLAALFAPRLFTGVALNLVFFLHAFDHCLDFFASFYTFRCLIVGFLLFFCLACVCKRFSCPVRCHCSCLPLIIYAKTLVFAATQSVTT